MPRKRPEVLGVDLNRSESAGAPAASLVRRGGGDGDDAWRDERAADPLHCLRIDAQTSGDLAARGAFQESAEPLSLVFPGPGLPEGLLAE
jgi:hypothetical protein